MKNIFNNLFWTMTVCGMIMTACSDDIDWKPGDAADGQGVYFPANQSSSMKMTETSGTFEVSVFRSVSAGATTAQITTTFSENAGSIFTVPAEVSFADGEVKSKLTVTYKNLVRDAKYALTISAVDNTPYGVSNLILNVVCPLVWEVVSTKAVLVDNLFEAFGAAGIQLTGITVEKHPDQNIYRFKSPYDNEYLTSLLGEGVLADDFVLPYIELDGETYPDGYFIAPVKLGWKMVNGGGPEASKDWASFGSVYKNLSDKLATYPLGSYDDSKKVFDLGAIYFCIDDSGEYNYPIKAKTLLFLNN